MKELTQLFKRYTGKDPEHVEEMQLNVSTRKYFRFTYGDHSLIGTYSPNERESRAFLYLADHLRSSGVAVPQVLDRSDDGMFYLQEDLGRDRFHERITGRTGEALSDEFRQIYHAIISRMLKMQFEGDRGLDYSMAYPRAAFDRQAIKWDLNHFKYYFLIPSGIAMDEQELEESFDAYASSVEAILPKGFMMRDLQSRNVMIQEGEPRFIDFQGGRKGPIHYDIASLIIEPKARLQPADRKELLEFYYTGLKGYARVDWDSFQTDFYRVALIRQLQALGTYGLRGQMERKTLFQQSIPGGLKNIEWLLTEAGDGVFPDYLETILRKMVELKAQYHAGGKSKQFTVRVTSFSYRRSYPDDLTGNGGGFVYDCRFLTNPGRVEEIKGFNGLEQPVIDFLEEKGEVTPFLEGVQKQIATVIESYKQRGYTDLSLAFGCTGGKHRSVFSARAIARWCRDLPGVSVVEIHRELGRTF